MGLVIVTGGAGFIGSHVVDKLTSMGFEVVIVDDLSSGSEANLKHAKSTGKVELLKLSVSHRGFVGELKASLPGRPEGIVHLAAVVSVEEARRIPFKAMEVNVGGTVNVMEAAVKLDVDAVVVTSSAAVYGEPRSLPVREDHPLEPVNLYGLSKLAAEKTAIIYRKEYGLRVAALRVFNAYGPRMRPGPYAGVVYKFIHALLSGEAPIIYGDGLQTRDFVYVGDVAEAHVKALTAKASGVYNVGSGVETSVLDLFRLLCTLVGRCPKPRRAPPRRGDVRRSVADISKAREELGWSPKVGLEEGLKATIEYFNTSKTGL